MQLMVVLQSFTCVLLMRHTYGSDNWNAYINGIQEQISLPEVQEFSEKAGKIPIKRKRFACPDMKPSSEVPSSAHQIKPADVKIIAALGGSLIAGTGINATSNEEIFIEYRHLSWSIGGFGNFSDMITLPNIFKLFNPDIIGFSKDLTQKNKPTTVNITGFNFGASNTHSHDLPDQTRHLISTMKAYPDISFDNDWKLVTIFIGANDLCNYCHNKDLFSADSFISNVRESLDILYKELPRALINVVQIFWMEGLRHIKKRKESCLVLKKLCSCIIEPGENYAELNEVLEQSDLYQAKLEALIESGRYDDKENFAVLFQPFLKKARPPRDMKGNIDYSYYALDCFHFSIKGNEELAKALWNNMLQRHGEKVEVESFSEPIKMICPTTHHPYIYTRNNTHEPTTLASTTLNGSYLIILFLLILELEFL
ncbi:phospholipase B1, membrane-associated-like [Rhinatrema bivittatum]|uniref:phospholipase B1, membrane-associated-like n=1 Tax=Rhinatrema bivittatum TaxID=194408 RepID=UPI001129B376|nr:phospholipase B1, membrane-associated-like [Rhinatrema bivittatum]XP_029453571.1 phospholipase B1, membrane-associated-like [Rhinatrema bivittatum]